MREREVRDREASDRGETREKFARPKIRREEKNGRADRRLIVSKPTHCNGAHGPQLIVRSTIV